MVAGEVEALAAGGRVDVEPAIGDRDGGAGIGVDVERGAARRVDILAGARQGQAAGAGRVAREVDRVRRSGINRDIALKRDGEISGRIGDVDSAAGLGSRASDGGRAGDGEAAVDGVEIDRAIAGAIAVARRGSAVQGDVDLAALVDVDDLALAGNADIADDRGVGAGGDAAIAVGDSDRRRRRCRSGRRP